MYFLTYHTLVVSTQADSLCFKFWGISFWDVFRGAHSTEEWHFKISRVTSVFRISAPAYSASVENTDGWWIKGETWVKKNNNYNCLWWFAAAFVVSIQLNTHHQNTKWRLIFLEWRTSLQCFSLWKFFFTLWKEKWQLVASSPQRKTSSDICNLTMSRLQPEKYKEGTTALYLQFSTMNLKLATMLLAHIRLLPSCFSLFFRPYRRLWVCCMDATTACFEWSHLIFSLPVSSTLLSY